MVMHLSLSDDIWTPISAAHKQPHNGCIIPVGSRAPDVAKRSLGFQISQEEKWELDVTVFG